MAEDINDLKIVEELNQNDDNINVDIADDDSIPTKISAEEIYQGDVETVEKLTGDNLLSGDEQEENEDIKFEFEKEEETFTIESNAKINEDKETGGEENLPESKASIIDVSYSEKETKLEENEAKEATGFIEEGDFKSTTHKDGNGPVEEKEDEATDFQGEGKAGENGRDEEKPKEDQGKDDTEELSEGEKSEGEMEKSMEGTVEGKSIKVPSGFSMRKESTFEDITLAPEIELGYSSSEEEKEEEEQEEEVEEEEEGINREAVIESYKALQVEARPIVKKNIILLKKMAEHFKKRKMEHVYKTPELYSVDKEVRYHKQLLAFEEIRTIERKQRAEITKELEDLKTQKNKVIKTFTEEFDAFIAREREIGIGLINTKTGKPIPDRVVEQFLRRQVRKQKEVNEVRLAFIKIRDCVTAKEVQLRSLETFGENLHLIDYEQLRMENQNFSEKIEERDDELQRLRNKATSAIQIMAQLREKAHATDQKMEDLCEVLQYNEVEANNTRAYVTEIKKRRDFLRSETLRLRREAGLLTHPRLLEDFAVSIEEAARLSAQVQNLKNSFHDQKRSLSSLRKCIESRTLLASVGRNISVAPSTKPQRKKSIHIEQKESEFVSNYATRPKTKPVHAVTSELLSKVFTKASKPDLKRHPIKHQSRQSIRSVSVIPISKDRPSFFPLSYNVYMIGEKK